MVLISRYWDKGCPPPTPIIALFFCVSLGFAKGKSLTERAEQSISDFWGGAVSIQLEMAPIKPEWKNEIEARVKQSFFRKQVHFWRVQRGDSTLGYAMMDNVLGKSLPITFLLQFDSAGRILKGEILKYREPYGGGVQSKQWNAQFTGRTGDSTFIPGINVDGISGATISVQSLAKGYWKSALLVNKLKLREIP